MKSTCPGSDVAITIKPCPMCGEEVELFTGDAKAQCPGCGHWVPREVAACIDWCPAAKECYKHVFEENEARAAEEKKAGAADTAEKTSENSETGPSNPAGE